MDESWTYNVSKLCKYYKGDKIPIDAFLNVYRENKVTTTVVDLDKFFTLFENPVSFSTIQKLSSCFGYDAYIKFRPNLNKYSFGELTLLYSKARKTFMNYQYEDRLKQFVRQLFDVLSEENVSNDLKKFFINVIIKNYPNYRDSFFSDSHSYPHVVNDPYVLYHMLDYTEDTLKYLRRIIQIVKWKILHGSATILNKLKNIIKIYYIEESSRYKPNFIQFLKEYFSETFIRDAIGVGKNVDIDSVDKLTSRQLLQIYTKRYVDFTHSRATREKCLLEFINEYKSFQLIKTLNRRFFEDLYNVFLNNDKDIDVKETVFLAQEVLKEKGRTHNLLNIQNKNETKQSGLRDKYIFLDEEI